MTPPREVLTARSHCWHLRLREGKVWSDGISECSLGRPEGIHASWHWDGRQLRVQNCQLGFWPLFYREVAGGLSVGESATDLHLPGADAKLDYDALSVFLALGLFAGRDAVLCRHAAAAQLGTNLDAASAGSAFGRGPAWPPRQPI